MAAMMTARGISPILPWLRVTDNDDNDNACVTEVVGSHPYFA